MLLRRLQTLPLRCWHHALMPAVLGSCWSRFPSKSLVYTYNVGGAQLVRVGRVGVVGLICRFCHNKWLAEWNYAVGRTDGRCKVPPVCIHMWRDQGTCCGMSSTTKHRVSDCICITHEQMDYISNHQG